MFHEDHEVHFTVFFLEGFELFFKLAERGKFFFNIVAHFFNLLNFYLRGVLKLFRMVVIESDCCGDFDVGALILYEIQ